MKYFAQEKANEGSKLQRVLCSDNRFTDEGLAGLAGLASLKSAYIAERGVTGKGLITVLPKCQNLRNVTVEVHGQTTLQDVVALQQLLPHCEVGFFIRSTNEGKSITIPQ